MAASPEARAPVPSLYPRKKSQGQAPDRYKAGRPPGEIKIRSASSPTALRGSLRGGICNVCYGDMGSPRCSSKRPQLMHEGAETRHWLWSVCHGRQWVDAGATVDSKVGYDLLGQLHYCCLPNVALRNLQRPKYQSNTVSGGNVMIFQQVLCVCWVCNEDYSPFGHRGRDGANKRESGVFLKPTEPLKPWVSAFSWLRAMVPKEDVYVFH